ncbi:MAG: DUF4863 family protein [Acidobacteriota bacterium]
MSDLLTLLEPISTFVPELDLTDGTAAEAKLNERFPPGSDTVRDIETAAREALERGEICDRGDEGMKWGRVAKPEAVPGGSSIDAVHMTNSAGPPHTHPNGEVCLCLPLSEEAKFENRHETWVVMPAGSRHVPEVKDGEMLILYWLPEGAVTWG